MKKTAYLSIFLLLPFPTAFAQSLPHKRPILVELYTSQGCISCPPADEFFGMLTADPSLLPLSFHVDYWDRMGWKDPFSHPYFTERQFMYNKHFGTPGNYTPQAVVDGVLETVASYRSLVLNLIEEAKAAGSNIPVVLAPKGKGMQVSIPEGMLPMLPATIWLVGYDAQKTTYIGGGDNRGKQLSSYNVVRYLERLGTYEGMPVNLRVTFHWKEAPDKIAVIVQEYTVGRVLGVGVREYPSLRVPPDAK